MAEDPNIHTLIYGQAYPTVMDVATEAGKAFAHLYERYPDKNFFVSSLVTGKIQAGMRFGMMPEEPVQALNGIPFLQGSENTLRAVKSLNDYAEFLRRRATSGDISREESAVAEQARAIVQAAGGKPLVERTAKQLLNLYGIPTTLEQLATTADEAVVAANAIGFPVVLKIESPDITHKTDAGGVLLNLRDDAAVRSGFDQIMSSARAYNPDAELSGVLVGQMAPRGREMIVGMTRDPDFGPAVAVGLGGIFVEVLKDVALGVPPLSEMAARDMLDRLRGKAILEGTRGQGPADVDAIVDVLLKFSQLCVDLRDDVVEIDINPLLVYEDGALVVDCLVVAG